MNANYITPQAFDAAAMLFAAIQDAKAELEKPQTLADKLALKRDIARLMTARRTILGQS